MEDLASNQLKMYAQIKQEFENYKKYGSRRHSKIIKKEEKLVLLKSLWSSFLAGNGKITPLATENQDHDYFTKIFFFKRTKGV